MIKNIRKAFYLFLLVAVILTTSACSNNSEEEVEPVIKKQVEIQAIVKQNEVNTNLVVSGTVVPKQYSMVRSLTPGTIEYLAPVGSEVYAGQPLFSIRDEAVESGYFNARQSLEQTNLVTGQRVEQAELALNSANARLALAQSSYDNTVAQTAQNMITVEDSAVVAYNSAYNSLNQTLNTLSQGIVTDDSFDYAYKNLLTPYSVLRSETDSMLSIAANNFLDLPITVDKSNVRNSLTQMQGALASAKLVVDNTMILLQSAIPDAQFSSTVIATDTTILTSQQTLINQHLAGVINSINSISNTEVSNTLALDNAQNQLNLAEIDYNNAEISLQSAKDGAELERSVTQAQFDSAAYNYSNLTLAAPFSGTILSHFANPGEQVSVGQQLIELGNLSIIEINVDVDVAFAKAIKLGDEVMIDEQYKGIVTEVEPVGDLTSGKINVTVQSSEAEDNLVAGSVADVKFNLLYSDIDTIVVPMKSVTIEASGNYVFTLDENNMVARKSVVLGQVFGDKVSVVSGLEEGDNLILLNGVFISAGDEVEVISQ